MSSATTVSLPILYIPPHLLISLPLTWNPQIRALMVQSPQITVLSSEEGHFGHDDVYTARLMTDSWV